MPQKFLGGCYCLQQYRQQHLNMFTVTKCNIVHFYVTVYNNMILYHKVITIIIIMLFYCWTHVPCTGKHPLINFFHLITCSFLCWEHESFYWSDFGQRNIKCTVNFKYSSIKLRQWVNLTNITSIVLLSLFKEW